MPIVRPLSPADEETLAGFFQRNNVSETVRHFNPFPLTADSARKILREARRDLYWGAFRGSEMVGFGMLRGWDEGYDTPSLGVLVDGRFRRRGIARLLAQQALADARSRGCARVRLTVHARNASALALYRNLGFVEDSRSPVTVQGEADEKIVMFRLM